MQHKFKRFEDACWLKHTTIKAPSKINFKPYNNFPC